MENEKKVFIQKTAEELMKNLQESHFLENTQKFIEQNLNLRPFIEKTIGEQAKFLISSILKDKSISRDIPSMM